MFDRYLMAGMMISHHLLYCLASLLRIATFHQKRSLFLYDSFKI